MLIYIKTDSINLKKLAVSFGIPSAFQNKIFSLEIKSITRKYDGM